MWMKSFITIAASSLCKHEILTDRHNEIYGVPFPPKFNVSFYIVLCTIYPTLCVCHLSLHSRFNFFAFNIQLWFMQHSSFRFRHSTFHKQQSGFGILPSSSVECTFIFSHPTFSICPLSFRFRHPTLSIVLASFRIRHSTFRLWLLPAGQRPIKIVGSIDLTYPRSNGGRETSQSSGLGRPSPLPTNQTSTTTWPIASMLHSLRGRWVLSNRLLPSLVGHYTWHKQGGNALPVCISSA